MGLKRLGMLSFPYCDNCIKFFTILSWALRHKCILERVERRARRFLCSYCVFARSSELP